MKRKIITLFLCFIVGFGSKTVAQDLPKPSENGDVWYYIASGSADYPDYYITDVTSSGNDHVKFELQKKMAGDDHLQQWKLIKPINAENDNVHFVNRATQSIIQTQFDFDGYYNVRATTSTDNSNGWKIATISGNQTKISGLDETGITGYLNVSSDQEAIVDIPINSKFLDSTYSWIFELADDRTSIPDVYDPFADVKIYVENKKIIVENATDYTVYHISGLQVSSDATLPAGVYLVKIQGQAKSVLVK